MNKLLIAILTLMVAFSALMLASPSLPFAPGPPPPFLVDGARPLLNALPTEFRSQQAQEEFRFLRALSPPLETPAMSAPMETPSMLPPIETPAMSAPMETSAMLANADGGSSTGDNIPRPADQNEQVTRKEKAAAVTGAIAKEANRTIITNGYVPAMIADAAGTVLGLVGLDKVANVVKKPVDFLAKHTPLGALIGALTDKKASARCKAKTIFSLGFAKCDPGPTGATVVRDVAVREQMLKDGQIRTTTAHQQLRGMNPSGNTWGMREVRGWGNAPAARG